MADDDDALGDELERSVAWGTVDQRLALPIWHYTDGDGLAGILQTREIWASHFACTNDPRELTHGEKILSDEVAKIAAELRDSSIHAQLLERFVEKIYPALKMSARVETHTFVASFCADGDSLLHWHAYGSGGDGYSIGLGKLPSVGEDMSADLGFFALPLEYNEKAFRVTVRRRFTRNYEDYCRFVANIEEARWERLAQRFAALQLRTAGALSVAYKHDSFRTELESRCVAALMKPHRHESIVSVRRRKQSPGRLIHYVKLPLARPPELLPIDGIVVGPLEKGRTERRAAAVELLRSLGYSNPEAMVRESSCRLLP